MESDQDALHGEGAAPVPESGDVAGETQRRVVEEEDAPRSSGEEAPSRDDD